MAASYIWLLIKTSYLAFLSAQLHQSLVCVTPESVHHSAYCQTGARARTHTHTRPYVYSVKAPALNGVSQIPSSDHTAPLPLGGWFCHLAHRCLKPFFFRLQLMKNQVIPDLAIDWKSASPLPRSGPPHP